jgi:hypothetical protein
MRRNIADYSGVGMETTHACLKHDSPSFPERRPSSCHSLLTPPLAAHISAHFSFALTTLAWGLRGKADIIQFLHNCLIDSKEITPKTEFSLAR